MNKGKVLVVDDEREVAGSLEGLFKALGYDMVAAFSGKEALGYLAEMKFDAILLDIRMPGIDGREVIKRVKKDNPRVKIVVFTAYGLDYKEDVEKLGVQGFFEKPLNMLALIHHIEGLLSKSEAIVEPEKTEKEKTDHKTPKAKILFIEPSPMIQALTCAYFTGRKELAEGDYEVKVTFSYGTAMKIMYEFCPDIIVMYDAFMNPDDAKNYASLMMRSSHKPKVLILHSVMPISRYQELEFAKEGITFCNQNTMTDEHLREVNKRLVSLVKEKCLTYNLIREK